MGLKFLHFRDFGDQQLKKANEYSSMLCKFMPGTEYSFTQSSGLWPLIQLTCEGFADKAEPLSALWQVPHTVNHPGGNTDIFSQEFDVWGFAGPVGVVHRWTIHPGHGIS